MLVQGLAFALRRAGQFESAWAGLGQ